jgi:hypothetical protein
MTIGFLLMAVVLPALAVPRQAVPPPIPWGAATLEWQCSSPPPAENFDTAHLSPATPTTSRISSTTPRSAGTCRERDTPADAPAHRNRERAAASEPTAMSTITDGPTPEHRRARGAPGPPLRHRRSSSSTPAVLGMWLFLATEILLFAGLFCAYAVYRANHPEIFYYAYHEHYPRACSRGSVNTAVLLCSSFTIAAAVWTHPARQPEARPHGVPAGVDAPRRLRLHGHQVHRVQAQVGARPPAGASTTSHRRATGITALRPKALRRQNLRAPRRPHPPKPPAKAGHPPARPRPPHRRKAPRPLHHPTPTEPASSTPPAAPRACVRHRRRPPRPTTRPPSRRTSTTSSRSTS